MEDDWKCKVMWWGVLLGSLAMLCSCGGVQYVPVESVRTEYVVQERVQYDSIYLHDSIAVMSKADTVYVEKYKNQYLYKYIDRRDTLLRCDTIEIPIPVERRLNRWEKTKMELGGVAIGVVVSAAMVAVGWLIIRRSRLFS